MSRMAELTTSAAIADALRNAKTVAVLGAHEEPSRPAFYVPDYLYKQGYRILPVNAMLVGKALWGQPVRASLAELKEPVDIVDVFRRPEALQSHLEDILAMSPRPRLVWLQLGIRNDTFARDVQAAGIDIVQDHCMLADHRAFGIGRVGG
ncbi:Succinyl-CoA synthetase, alpha subunit-related enzyme [Minicystis rosea]|nr:Succinyl-CoA synthetase, alpha subunit-related enzyme [Minicystis rosea]